MVRLVEPNERYIESYIKAFEEYKEHNISSYGLSDATESDILEKFDNYRNERNLKPGDILVMVSDILSGIKVMAHLCWN